MYANHSNTGTAAPDLDSHTQQLLNDLAYTEAVATDLALRLMLARNEVRS
jgi:hypothetical protein